MFVHIIQWKSFLYMSCSSEWKFLIVRNEMDMKKVNCRNTKMCIVCKQWIGEKANVKYHIGKCKMSFVTGQYILDKTE